MKGYPQGFHTPMGMRSVSKYTVNLRLSLLGKYRRRPAIDPPLFQCSDLLWVSIIHISTTAPGQRNVHSTPTFRYLVAIWLIGSNAAARKGMIPGMSREEESEAAAISDRSGCVGCRVSGVEGRTKRTGHVRMVQSVLEMLEFKGVWSGIFVFLELIWGGVLR